MADSATPGGYAALSEPATLTIHRVLPGPIERVWAYLTQGELRRKWLASGDMALQAGAPFEMVWRNDELTTPPGERPPGFEAEHRMSGRILEVQVAQRLVITWGESSEVAFDLREDGPRVLLTVTHRRAPSREVMLKVAAGWHGHLDILAARLTGTEPAPFWQRWCSLRTEYAQRLPE